MMKQTTTKTFAYFLQFLCICCAVMSFTGVSYASDDAKAETTRITLTYRDPQPNFGEVVADKRQRRLERQENIDLFGSLGTEDENLAANGPDDQIAIVLDVTPRIIHVENSDIIRFETSITEVSKWLGDAVRDDMLQEVRNEYAMALIRLRSELKRSLTRVEAEELEQNGTLQLDMLNSEFQSVFSHFRLLDDPLKKIKLVYTPEDPLPNIRIIKLGAVGTAFEPGNVEYDVPFWVEVYYESEPLEPPVEVNIASTDSPINVPVLRLNEDEFIWRSRAVVLRKEDEDDPFGNAMDPDDLEIDLGPEISSGCDQIANPVDRAACELEFVARNRNLFNDPINLDTEFENSNPLPEPEIGVLPELPSAPVQNIVKDACGNEFDNNITIDANDPALRDCVHICDANKPCKWVNISGKPPRVVQRYSETTDGNRIQSSEPIDNASTPDRSSNTQQIEDDARDAANSINSIGSLLLPTDSLPDLNGITDPKLDNTPITPSPPDTANLGDAISIDTDVRKDDRATTNDLLGILPEDGEFKLSDDVLPDLTGKANTPTDLDSILPDVPSGRNNVTSLPLAPRIDEGSLIPQTGGAPSSNDDLATLPELPVAPEPVPQPKNSNNDVPLGIEQSRGATLNAGTPIMSSTGRPDLGVLEGTPLGELILKLGKDSPVITQLTKDGVQESDQLTAKAILDALK